MSTARAVFGSRRPIFEVGGIASQAVGYGGAVAGHAVAPLMRGGTFFRISIDAVGGQMAARAQPQGCLGG
jgi:hypothetical protein